MNELNYNMIMGVIYGAMWDYNLHVRESTDELCLRKRAYINGISTMAATVGIRVIVTYENIFINSSITDITVNGKSVSEWKIGIESKGD